MSKEVIKVPSAGESVTEADIGEWFFKDGDWVEKDDVVMELETDKASMEVNAPASGVLHIAVEEGETVQVGKEIGHVDTSAEKPDEKPDKKSDEKSDEKSTGKQNEKAGAESDAESSEASDEKKKTSSASEKPSEKTSDSSTGQKGEEKSKSSKKEKKQGDEKKFSSEDLEGLSPSDRKAVREGRLDLSKLRKGSSSEESSGGRKTRSKRVKMSRLRKRVAQRLLESQQQTATLTTFNEVDLTKVMEIRSQLKEDFLSKHDVKLGFMSFFAKACSYAAEEVPVVNAGIAGDEIVYYEDFHLGVAVSTDRGLVVPVLSSVQDLNYGEIEKQIAGLAGKARDGKLSIDDMQGGTFTITNGGVFGSLVSTPILNPPQSAILGMHKIEQRPMAVKTGEGHFAVEIRPMMYLALSYDHRLIDGKDSVTFLVKVKEYLEGITKDDVSF